MTELEGRTMAWAAGGLLLAGLLRMGFSLDAVPPPPGDPGEAEALLAASAVLAEEEERRSRPLGPGERIDANSADDVELSRLPGVGPALARAIVRNREDAGAFATVDALDRVPGIGAATLAGFRDHVSVGSGAGAPPTRAPPARGNGRQGGTGQVGPQDRGTTIDVNRATERELEALPGIGPALARRLVEYRALHGPFRVPEDLVEVPGIGPVILQRIRDHIRIGG